MVVNKLILSVNEVDALENVIRDSIINYENIRYYLGIDKESIIKYSLFFNKVDDVFDVEDIKEAEVELSLDVNDELKIIIQHYINRNVDRIDNEEKSILIDIIEKLDCIKEVEISNVMSYRV